MTKQDDRELLGKRLKSAKRLIQVSRFTVGFLLVMVFFNLVSGNYAWAGLQAILIAILTIYLREIRRKVHK